MSSTVTRMAYYYFKVGKGSPLTYTGRRGVPSFCARHIPVSLAFDGGTYLLSVAALPSPPQKEGSYQLRFGWPSDAPGIGLGLTGSEFGVLTTTLSGTHLNAAVAKSLSLHYDRHRLQAKLDTFKRIAIRASTLNATGRLRVVVV